MAILLRWIKTAFRVVLAGTVIVLLLIAGYTAALVISRQSALILPVPTGKFGVGRIELDWTFPQRLDPLSDQNGLKRELPVWVWYPARVDPSQKPAPYFPAAWSEARNMDQGIGILIESDLTKIVTHSYENAPLDPTQFTYPILVMEPGMGPAIPDYTVLAENLASHGYIVVGINPTYTSFLVSFPDGRIVSRSAKGAIPDNASPEEADQIANRIMAVWVQDVIFTMDRLDQMNGTHTDTFYQRLDLQHVGVFGHSFGGATAIAVCQQDPRCKAAANLDGTPFSTEANILVPTPILLMSEDYSNGCDQNCTSFRQMAGKVKSGPVYDLSVQGAGHFNFSDLLVRQVPAVRPLFRAAQYTGSIDPLRGEQIANAYLLAFFDQSLKNLPSELLKGPSDLYPEVKFQ